MRGEPLRQAEQEEVVTGSGSIYERADEVIDDEKSGDFETLWGAVVRGECTVEEAIRGRLPPVGEETLVGRR